MGLRYVGVYKIRVVNGLSGDDPLGLYEGENPNITATLTADPEPYFEHTDRSHALVGQLFIGLFGDKEEGTPEERLDPEIARIQAESQGKKPSGMYIVFAGSDEIDPPEFKTRTDRAHASLGDRPA